MSTYSEEIEYGGEVGRDATDSWPPMVVNRGIQQTNIQSRILPKVPGLTSTQTKVCPAFRST